MTKRHTAVLILWSGVLAALVGTPAFARFGAEAGPPILATAIQGQRLDVDDWPRGEPTSNLTIGLGDGAVFWLSAWDEDIYYDPFSVYDELFAEWKVTDASGELAAVSRFHEHAQVCEEPGTGRLLYAFACRFFPLHAGTFTVTCDIDDVHGPGAPDDDPAIRKTTSFQNECWFRINQVFSTDLTNKDPGSPYGGLVGVDVEWTAGFPPHVMAVHQCESLWVPQQIPPWSAIEEQTPDEYPHRGTYYWDSSAPRSSLGDMTHNGEWTLIVQPAMVYDGDTFEMFQQTRPFQLQNLTVTAEPEYIVQSTDGAGGTIDYALKDAFEVCAPAQETGVGIGIFSSDGMTVRSDGFVKTAGRGASFTYSWDGKDDSGELAPKGIYTYMIRAEQWAELPDPLGPPGAIWRHDEQDSDKSEWILSTTQPEIIACNEETGAATIRMGYRVSPAVEGRELSRAKLEVYDPDLAMVAHAEANPPPPLPVGQTLYFPDVSVTFDKGGTYVFLVSAWEKLKPDLWSDRAHREKPLLQQNADLYVVPRYVLIDPGHGQPRSENYGTHGCYYSKAPTEELKNTNRYAWDEHDMVLALGIELRRSLTSLIPGYDSRCSMAPVRVFMSRTSGSGMTLAERVAWADTIAKRFKGAALRFISLHCNGHTSDYDSDNFVAWRKPEDSGFADWVRLALEAYPPFFLTYGANQQQGYQVLSCTMPAVLVETATLTNPYEEEWVAWQDDSSNLRSLADRLRMGVVMSLDH